MPGIKISRQTINLEKVIAGKNPSLLKIIPGFFLRYLKRIIHLEEVNAGLYRLREKMGLDFVDAVVDLFELQVETRGEEHLDGQEPLVVVSNHPLGGLDGVALMSIVGRHRELVFPVNDLLMNLPNLEELFVPVNKHGSNVGNFRFFEDAFASGRTVVHFPAGLCSRRKGQRIRDLKWQKSFLPKARKYGRNVVATFIGGENSSFFYTLANLRRWFSIRANVEMLFLVDEMFKQKNRRLKIVFGRPVPIETFDKRHSDWEWAEKLRLYVYRLGRNENAVFDEGQPLLRR